MSSFFYPTTSPLFEKRFEEWKSSEKEYLVFPFLKTTPKKLLEGIPPPFWMYLYFSDIRTSEPNLRQVVKFRVQVVSYALDITLGDDIFTCTDFDTNRKPTIWFKCNVVEEIEKEKGIPLGHADFKHLHGKVLTSAIRNSIAPIFELSNFNVVNSYIND